MKTQNLPETNHCILSEEAAQRRFKAWQQLRETGASLTWHPVAIDKVLNTSEQNSITSLATAVNAAATGIPVLFESANKLVTVLNERREETPFWAGFLRPAATHCMPAFLRGDTGLVDRCTEVLWDTMVEIERAYVPVGVGDNGLPRPHYFHYFLQLCLRSVWPKVTRFCKEATARRIDDLSERSQYADPVASNPEAIVENRECRAALIDALGRLPQDPRMLAVFDLLVGKGLSIREAESVSGMGKSTIQREVQALAQHLQNAFTKHYGLPMKGGPDAATIISAIRAMVSDGMQLPGFRGTTKTPAKILPFPISSNNHPDQCA
jgi:hypothetical protein